MSEYKDSSGKSLPSSLVKYTRIPRQMSSEEEAKRVEAQGETASDTTKNTVITNIIINVLLAGSFTLVWDMIEGL